MFSIFNEEVQKVLLNANKEMLSLKHKYIGSEHIFLSLLTFDNEFSAFLKRYDITYDKYKTKLVELVGIGNEKSTMQLYTPLLKKILEEAMLLAKERKSDEVEISDIIMAIFEEEEGIGIRILNTMGIDYEKIDEYYYNSTKRKTDDRKLLIEDFGIDLTNKAKNNELDPVIGRNEEIQRIIEVLCRKYKNNPLLVGPAGVGKTAIVEELAKLIFLKKVPNKLLDKRIISVSLSSLVANTKYRGEFEDRITKMLKEIEDNPDIILFIDEIHTIMGAGGAEGAIDAANIFKPALSRGNIRLIGATTLDEYKNTIEKDKAMERRFQKINVDAPTREETREILKGLKDTYERFHDVRIDDEIIEKIVSLSDRYIHNKYEPDRSIDILDDVCSKVSLMMNKDSRKIKEYYDELNKLCEEKNKYLKLNDFTNAYLIKRKEGELNKKIIKLTNKDKGNCNKVNTDDIYDVISFKTGITVNKLKNNNKDIELLTKQLKKEIIGQSDVIDRIISITKKNRYNFIARKPLSFLLVGPNGCGKTKLANLYGKYLFKDKIIHFDGNEYQEKETINKILGSPSGYVGYDDNNRLEEIRCNPYSLIIFENIEKACTDVINIFMQIIDEGKIMNNKGNMIYFDNCTIIFTTSMFTYNDIGFIENDGNNTKKVDIFPQKDILNRVENCVLFNKLKYDDIYSILKKEIKNVKQEFEIAGIKVNPNILKELILKTNYFEKGAKEIRKVVLDYIDGYITDKKLYS